MHPDGIAGHDLFIEWDIVLDILIFPTSSYQPAVAYLLDQRKAHQGALTDSGPLSRRGADIFLLDHKYSNSRFKLPDKGVPCRATPIHHERGAWETGLTCW